MPAGQSWPLDFKVISCCFHILAISSGIFRSTYRWYISRFGWEDTWALVALFTDVGCLICSWLQQSVPPVHPSNTDIIISYVATVTVTSVPWEARLSMIATIIRITNPRARIRRLSYAVAVSFGLMWIATLARKLYICGLGACAMTHDLAISQLTTDVISDALLLVMPIFFLKGMKISRGQRLLLVSSFASSICITIISIAHSVTLFMPLFSTSRLIVYIKAALALLICNLLVIVTFVYRVWNKTDMDLGGIPGSERVQFTTIIPGQATIETFSHSTLLPKSSIHHVSSSCED